MSFPTKKGMNSDECRDIFHGALCILPSIPIWTRVLYLLAQLDTRKALWQCLQRPKTYDLSISPVVI